MQYITDVIFFIVFLYANIIVHGNDWPGGLQRLFKVFIENGDEGMKVKAGGNVAKAGFPHSIPVQGGGITVHAAE
jgi:hypothetical protein